MDWPTVKRLRQWVRDVNKLGEKYGHEEMAGTPDEPDAEMVDVFERGLTPEQAVAECFCGQRPNSE
jgi:hypothetical protein